MQMQRIEYTVAYGDIKQEMVVLFDGRDFSSEDEVMSLVKSGEHSPKLVTMAKSQFETVFRSLINREG